MKIARYLKSEQICLDMDEQLAVRLGTSPGDPWNGDPWERKVAVLTILTGMLAATGRVGSAKKLLADLQSREKKASTALGRGIAVPHVRTKQAKRFLMAFARSDQGIDFDAPDGEPVHLFFCLCAPPYDDRIYLDAYRWIGMAFGFPEAAQALRQARDAHEVLRVLTQFQDYPVIDEV